MATRTSENSTAIDRGTVPQSKSDEFLKVRMAYNTAYTILYRKPPKKVMRIFGARLVVVVVEVTLGILYQYW